MDIEKIISLEQLSGDQRELAETVGIEAYRKIVGQYGGNSKIRTIVNLLRNTDFQKQE